MYIKIYFNSKPLFLCDGFNEEINAYAHHDDAVFIDEFSTAAVNSMIHEMKMEKVHAGIFYHNDLQALRKAFWKKFILVRAGGGLVENENKQALFIFRRGKWDLPKGKLDKGETIEACALREVKEETGIASVQLQEFLLNTYHVYDENGKHILKESSWYRMKAGSHQTLAPQLEEQITELRWVTEKEMSALMKNTFPLIADILTSAGYLSR
jgi:8-oxo-dGTP pyrophosphatase MutT (NUDIX family)